MTSNTFLNRLDWIAKNVKEYEEFEESRALEQELEEYRLKKHSTEYSKLGGVRDV